MRNVQVGATPLDVLSEVLGEKRYAALVATALSAHEAMAGRVLMNVSSTAVGGGVAEMLQSLLAYARGADIDARWQVIDAPPEFFAITKRVHNHLYGNPGDGGQLGADERATYETTLDSQVDDLLALIHPGDVVLLHDPQTLGLAPRLTEAGMQVVWRCHVGIDEANELSAAGWSFLEPYLDAVQFAVFSRAEFAPPQILRERLRVIPPSIDPLAVKNLPLSDVEIRDVLTYAGLLQGEFVEAPVYHRRDGSRARVDRRADVVQLGPPPPPDAPLVVQVSRWDRLKDMTGVMEAFAQYVNGATPAHLILVGSAVTGVEDDPEGAAVFSECFHAWRKLPHAERQRVHLACIPTGDVDENAVIINALQRHAAIVTQKSLAEGFGLTVVEAMWKSRPVVASRVGGIVDQIDDDTCGLLVDDPTDLAAFGAALRRLLDEPALADKMGAAAHERAREFLPDVHLGRWAAVVTEAVSGQGRRGRSA